MNNKPKNLTFHKFGSSDPLHQLATTTQVKYLRVYLSDIGAQRVLEEPNYFDRDFLAEFSAFYGISSVGYPNVCKRLHFFSDASIGKRTLRAAACGKHNAIKKLQDNYLGFVVVRPIPSAPLGRTVVKWYPDSAMETPRVVSPSRDYTSHIAGISLQVHGLAWQQQDTGVGACATIGLWTILHSSAFDDHHAIPTTADITRAAHKTASLGARVFPSAGLSVEQICESVKEYDLAPIIIRGEKKLPNGEWAFSKERFSSSCAASIRSGYPVLIIGELDGCGKHAVCAVGFRSCSPSAMNAYEIGLQDSNIEYIYIHDDNLGPNVRFSINCDGNGVAYISPTPPPNPARPPNDCPTHGYPKIIPYLMLVAVHNDLRTSPDTLHRTGITNADNLVKAINPILAAMGKGEIGLSVSTRYMKLASYLGEELDRTLNANPKLLGDVRMRLSECVSPMSLHLGVIRIGLDDATPLVDILYDTTDSDRNHPAFAHVCYNMSIPLFLHSIQTAGKGKYGTPVQAY
jgi:hypothetical protein